MSFQELGSWPAETNTLKSSSRILVHSQMGSFQRWPSAVVPVGTWRFCRRGRQSRRQSGKWISGWSSAARENQRQSKEQCSEEPRSTGTWWHGGTRRKPPSHGAVSRRFCQKASEKYSFVNDVEKVGSIGNNWRKRKGAYDSNGIILKTRRLCTGPRRPRLENNQLPWIVQFFLTKVAKKEIFGEKNNYIPFREGVIEGLR